VAPWETIMAFEIKANDHEGGVAERIRFSEFWRGESLRPLWLDLCRQLENPTDLERTAGSTRPLRRPIQTGNKGCWRRGRGRIYLKRLNRPADALRCYEAAHASIVPHSDWQATIDRA